MADPHQPTRLKWEDSHVRKLIEERDAAVAACRVLVNAYDAAEAGGSVEWSHIDDAVALAKEAINLVTK